MDNTNKEVKKRTVVFDLDGSLETPYYSEDQAPKVKEWMKAHPTGCAYGKLHVTIKACGQTLPHFIFPGTFELLRWVHDHGFEIVFFSNAVADRNKVLCPILMERAFGKGKEPPYRIFSRNDCIDTTHLFNEEKEASLQGLWHGNYKKKLAGVVVHGSDVTNTIMIEDDSSYAAKGEERNFVYGVYGGCAANYLNEPELSKDKGQDFHLPFYFCGMLKRIVDFAEKTGVSLAEASEQVQYGDYGLAFPSNGERRQSSTGSLINVPYPPQRSFQFYVDGLQELRQYNKRLSFWNSCQVNEKSWGWPDPNRPPPPPPPPKRKVKTDMTRKEANYWLAQLRQLLCKIKRDNIKSIWLMGDCYENTAMAGESDWVRVRHAPFDGDDWFNVKKVKELSIGGYLPVPLDEERQKDFRNSPESYLGYVHAGTEMFRIFQRVIEEFLFEVFRLRVYWEKMDRSIYEHWSVPVKYVKPTIPDYE